MSHYICRTYLDEGRTKQWPTEFVICPRIGDRVQAECGYRLKVVGITHCTKRDEYNGHRVTPYVEVELSR